MLSPLWKYEAFLIIHGISVIESWIKSVFLFLYINAGLLVRSRIFTSDLISGKKTKVWWLHAALLKFIVQVFMYIELIFVVFKIILIKDCSPRLPRNIMLMNSSLIFFTVGYCKTWMLDFLVISINKSNRWFVK